MTMNKIYKALRLKEIRFTTSKQIGELCKSFGCNTSNTIRNLMSGGYLVRIFRGIFYIRSNDEVKFNKNELTSFELITSGLEIKGVSNWYFGLQTALKMNKLTHEYYNIEYIINDTIFRKNPMNIAGSNIKFIKVRRELMDFGIKSEPYRHSDVEKTILDMIYLSKYNGRPDVLIVGDVSEYLENANKKILIRYSHNYPKTVRALLEEIV